MNPGRNNNSNDIRTVFTPDGMCFVENNGRQVLNKWNVPVRCGEKGILCPFSKHDPSYLIKFPLDFNGCFICSITTHHDKNMCPMKEQKVAMDAFYRELNIHKPHKYFRNKKNGEVPSADRQSAGLQNVCAAKNVQTCCITSCIFDTCYTIVWNVLHAEQ